ncbi:hypothetical protein ACH50O_18430 [Methylomonas sp. 2BW1-5-20]|uniref:hypothetical protein n=1 Tax=Methylomonas sp. 2BW1-5-20 TaxID=3376686 RepID=UPI00404D5180
MDKHTETKSTEDWRKIAENRLTTKSGIALDHLAHDYKLLHELQLHQIELELQNEELLQLEDDMEIAAAIIGMGHTLRLKVLAEGGNPGAAKIFNRKGLRLLSRLLQKSCGAGRAVRIASSKKLPRITLEHHAAHYD